METPNPPSNSKKVCEPYYCTWNAKPIVISAEVRGVKIDLGTEFFFTNECSSAILVCVIKMSC
jgi:hypothetical protein